MRTTLLHLHDSLIMYSFSIIVCVTSEDLILMQCITSITLCALKTTPKGQNTAANVSQHNLKKATTYGVKFLVTVEPLVKGYAPL